MLHIKEDLRRLTASQNRLKDKLERKDDLLTVRAHLLLTVKIRQPSHEFTFRVGMSFIPYPLVLTPVV
jgi:hypothetical protein